MKEFEHYIKSYFGIVQEEDLKNIVSFFKLKTIQKGNFLLKPNSVCEKLCFVESGILRTYRTTDTKEITLWISKKGHFSADISSFIFEIVSQWEIQALVDTEVYIITKEDYNKIGALVQKWPEFEKTFTISCFSVLEERVFSHLSMTAEERYESYFQQNKELFNQVPLQYIASFLGMTPETFSRIRKKQLL
ncbi:Crp/Fnr family transcriptional regulator [Flavobacterium jejuense]|uniref:Crp/Fnr family transcriptional regulator n=1 Tax=Flavobacterium jejuense TaxID=1544455 RepID=A0ABX0IS06_9FLAO|nr:Crp/Fnr family transcriptional regulator [Flavobacterium jejuense]NHN25258.1 Crp/Fnr family transcriptional regulator [Flavobacterium jejuense]